MKTTRLYYHDSYLKEFSAHIVDRSEDGLRVYLDRTAFYPASGGQPSDAGEIDGVPVLDVIDEERRIAHVIAEPLEEVEVACRIDWGRRFDHMQQHTGQHLLSAILVDLWGAQTVSFHLGADSSTVDVTIPSLDVAQVIALETRVNEIIAANRPVTVAFEAATDAAGLRKSSRREGTLRIVSIEDLDRSACGGTHVGATGEIGVLLIRKLEKIRGNVRIEFLCGMRAVRQAREDYESLSRIARVFSTSLEEAAALAVAQHKALEESEKTRRRLASELARFQGRELYESTSPGPDGVHRAMRRLSSGALTDEMRALAAGFTAQSKAIFVAAVDDPPSILLAVSPDAGVHAGEKLKTVLNAFGGRGGGSALVAQGSIPAREKLPDVISALS